MLFQIRLLATLLISVVLLPAVGQVSRVAAESHNWLATACLRICPWNTSSTCR